MPPGALEPLPQPFKGRKPNPWRPQVWLQLVQAPASTGDLFPPDHRGCRALEAQGFHWGLSCCAAAPGHVHSPTILRESPLTCPGGLPGIQLPAGRALAPEGGCWWAEEKGWAAPCPVLPPPVVRLGTVRTTEPELQGEHGRWSNQTPRVQEPPPLAPAPPTLGRSHPPCLPGCWTGVASACGPRPGVTCPPRRLHTAVSLGPRGQVCDSALAATQRPGDLAMSPKEGGLGPQWFLLASASSNTKGSPRRACATCVGSWGLGPGAGETPQLLPPLKAN